MAKDIMTKDVVVVTPKTTIGDAIKLLVNHRITGLPVVSSSGRLVGVVSEYDIIRSLKKRGIKRKLGGTWLRKKIRCAGADTVVTVGEKEPLETVLDRFIQTKNRRLPVVTRSGKLVGVITRRDIIRLLFYRSRLT